MRSVVASAFNLTCIARITVMHCGKNTKTITKAFKVNGGNFEPKVDSIFVYHLKANRRT